jgi:hypothetical protein
MFLIKVRHVLTILLFWNGCDKWLYYCFMVTFKLCIQCSPLCHLYQGSTLLVAKTATCAACIPSYLFPTTFTQTRVLCLHSQMLLFFFFFFLGPVCISSGSTSAYPKFLTAQIHYPCGPYKETKVPK